MKYPESTYSHTSKTPYMFVIYIEGEEEYYTDWYSKVDAQKMKSILDKSNETYNVMFSTDGSIINETSI